MRGLRRTVVVFIAIRGDDQRVTLRHTMRNDDQAHARECTCLVSALRCAAQSKVEGRANESSFSTTYLVCRCSRARRPTVRVRGIATHPEDGPPAARR